VVARQVRRWSLRWPKNPLAKPPAELMQQALLARWRRKGLEQPAWTAGARLAGAGRAAGKAISRRLADVNDTGADEIR